MERLALGRNDFTKITGWNIIHGTADCNQVLPAIRIAIDAGNDPGHDQCAWGDYGDAKQAQEDGLLEKLDLSYFPTAAFPPTSIARTTGSTSRTTGLCSTGTLTFSR